MNLRLYKSYIRQASFQHWKSTCSFRLNLRIPGYNNYLAFTLLFVIIVFYAKRHTEDPFSIFSNNYVDFYRLFVQHISFCVLFNMFCIVDAGENVCVCNFVMVKIYCF